MRRELLTLVAFAALAPAPVARAGEPSLVLLGGKVWTNDPAQKQAEAVAVEGERVVAVGDDREISRLAGPGTRVLNLNGATVVPGFSDHHVHVLEQGDLGSIEPSWSGYSPASAEAVRSGVFGYHAAHKAAGQTPEDACLPASPVTDSLKQKLLGVQDALARQGISTVVEAGLSDLGILRALQALDVEGRLRVRFVVRVGWGCIDEAAAMGLKTGVGSEWVKILGAKLYSDGWLGPRSAALREPYSDRPHNGFLFMDQARADADVARARELGFNVTTHAIGDLGMHTVLTAYEHNGVSERDRFQIEHAQVLADDLITRMARMGAIGSIQLSFATTDQRFAESALGPERAARAYAWRTLAERGVRLAGGSDYPVELINPLWGLQRIVTRTEFDGTPPGGWHPQQRLTVEEGLRLITGDGAFARLEERERGRVAPGHYADLVVLREDLFTLPVDCVAAATVLMTVTNGRVAFEGAQAYPPGDRTCPSGKAPAASPFVTSGSGGAHGGRPAVTPSRCRATASIARARGRRLRVRVPRKAGSVSAEVVRVASSSSPLSPRVARRLGRKRRAFWVDPGALRAGWYVLRLRGRGGVRETVFRRERGVVDLRPPFSLASRCGTLAAFRLSSPVFGGRGDRPLDIAYRLARAGSVSVEIRHEGRVVQRLGGGQRRAGRSYPLRFAAAGRPAGDYTVRIEVISGSRGHSADLVARRL